MKLDSPDLRRDFAAALAVTFMAAPQGVAYALIAGLPPAMGLYAACLPAIVGSLLRSSNHVVAGPTNALSLLIGTAVIGSGMDPTSTALTLAFMVGAIQLGAGLLRLGVLVDYISTPVVVGYITGAGVLIAVGQVPNVVVSPVAVGTALAVAAGIVGFRYFKPEFPAAALLIAITTLASWAADFEALGVQRIGDLAAIPHGLPPLTLPVLTPERVLDLMPIAVAATVLSLVESSAVARAISAQSGQHLDLNSEFRGQGLANVAAAFTGGYPISGSLGRTTLNYKMGAQTRWAGVFSGVLILGVLLVLGPALNYTPICGLAGLLFVVAYDLIDRDRIRKVVLSGTGDAMAFGATLVGTWVLPLDKAIYLGVIISLVVFLRRSSHLVARDLRLGPRGNLREFDLDEAGGGGCERIRILHIEGQLFFAAASELEAALTEATSDPRIAVLIVRLKRTQGLDITAAEVLRATGKRLQSQGRHLLLVGMREPAMQVLRASGISDELGTDHLFPTRRRWFAAMNEAIGAALALVEEHEEPCALRDYSERISSVSPTRTDT